MIKDKDCKKKYILIFAIVGAVVLIAGITAAIIKFCHRSDSDDDWDMDDDCDCDEDGCCYSAETDFEEDGK